MAPVLDSVLLEVVLLLPGCERDSPTYLVDFRMGGREEGCEKLASEDTHCSCYIPLVETEGQASP